MTTALNPVDAAIAQAQAQAQAQAAANLNQVPSPVQTQAPQAVANYQAPAPISMESLMNSTFTVDGFLKVSDAGILLRKDSTAKTAVESLDVMIDMREGFGFKSLLSVSFGDPVVYHESYDGITNTSGKPWTECVAEAASHDPAKCKPFQTVKLGVELLEKADGVEAGTTRGLTLTRTGVAPWVAFYKEVAAKGLLGHKVEAKLGYKVGEKKGYRSWGIPVFTLVGEYHETAGE